MSNDKGEFRMSDDALETKGEALIRGQFKFSNVWKIKGCQSWKFCIFSIIPCNFSYNSCVFMKVLFTVLI